MSYGKRNDYDETLDGRKVADPHPHWETNRDYLNVYLNLPMVKKRIFDPNNSKHDVKAMWQVVWDGINKDKFGNYECLTCCQIFWHTLKGRFGMSFNFHQPASKFKDEVDKFFSPMKEKAKSMDQLCH